MLLPSIMRLHGVTTVGAYYDTNEGCHWSSTGGHHSQSRRCTLAYRMFPPPLTPFPCQFMLLAAILTGTPSRRAPSFPAFWWDHVTRTAPIMYSSVVATALFPPPVSHCSGKGRAVHLLENGFCLENFSYTANNPIHTSIGGDQIRHENP